MEKKDIIKLFLDKGVMLDPAVLDFLYTNQEKIEIVLKNLKHEDKIITTDNLLNLLKNDTRNAEKESNVKILQPQVLDKVTIEHITKCLSKRLNVITSLLSKKPELRSTVSISKIKNNLKTFTTIGLVKEIEGDRLIIEDKTGHIELHCEKSKLEKIFLDEVVGVKGTKTNGMFFADKIIKPDIPIFRSMHKPKSKYVVTSSEILGSDHKFEINLDEIVNVFIDGFFISYISNNVLNLYGDGKKVIIDLLKGRNLHPTIRKRSKFYKNDPFLLEKIPELIVIPSEDLEIKNYKGITIAFLDNDHGIELPGRKIIKIV